MSNIQQPFKIAVAGVALFAEIGIQKCNNLGISGNLKVIQQFSMGMEKILNAERTIPGMRKEF